MNDVNNCVDNLISTIKADAYEGKSTLLDANKLYALVKQSKLREHLRDHARTGTVAGANILFAGADRDLEFHLNKLGKAID